MSYIGNQPISAAFLTDTFSGNGTTTAFTMSVAPANTSSIIVSITGVLQDPSTYSVSGTTLTFSAAPPSGTSNISVRYLGIPASGVTTTAYRTVTNATATAGQTSFTIPSYTVGYINVFRNGVYLPTTDYTASTGTTVVLNNAANAGDTITVESFLVSSVLNAIPATAGSVSTSYLVDGSVTQAKLGTNVAGNGPAFSAYLSSSQTVTSGAWTKVQANTEEFDTASCYDNTTNYRFTPNVAGYYQVNGSIAFSDSSTAMTSCAIAIYKNGSIFKWGNYLTRQAYAVDMDGVVSALIYMNGTTDYIELYAQATGTGTMTFTTAAGGQQRDYFQAFLARSA